MIVTFVIPNRDDPEKPPTLYETWGAEAVPREGETVVFGDRNGEADSTWIVKWVRHTFQTRNRDEFTHKIEVRLIEPQHWSRP